MTLVGDIFKTEERTKILGFLEASNGLGKVISPLAGAVAGLISWYAPFFVYGILAIPVGIAIMFVVSDSREALKKQSLTDYKRAVLEIFENKGVSLLSCFLSGMIALFVLFGVLSNYSDILEKTFKIRGFLKGVVIAGPVLAMTITAFTLGIFLEKMNKYFKPFIITGLALIAAGQVMYFLFSGFWIIFFAIVIIGIGVGNILPSVNTLVTGSVSTQRRGIITCLYGTVRFFGVAFGPPSYGIVEQTGKKIPLLIFPGLVVVTLVVALIHIKEQVLIRKKSKD